jgi:hypothetical protein
MTFHLMERSQYRHHVDVMQAVLFVEKENIVENIGIDQEKIFSKR